MKKSLYVLGATTFYLLSLPALCEVEEVYVYGTPYLSLVGSDIGGMSNYQIQNIQHFINVTEGRSTYEKIQEIQRLCAKRQAAQAGIPLDVSACQNAVRYKQSVLRQACEVNHGNFTWRFSYTGVYMTSGFTGVPHNSSIGCVGMVNAAAEASFNHCDISGQRVQQLIDNACAYLGK